MVKTFLARKVDSFFSVTKSFSCIIILTLQSIIFERQSCTMLESSEPGSFFFLRGPFRCFCNVYNSLEFQAGTAKNLPLSFSWEQSWKFIVLLLGPIFNRSSVARAVLTLLLMINSQLASWHFERTFTPHQVSYVRCHMSGVTCHVSSVTCLGGDVTIYLIIYFF